MRNSFIYYWRPIDLYRIILVSQANYWCAGCFELRSATQNQPHPDAAADSEIPNTSRAAGMLKHLKLQAAVERIRTFRP